MVTYSGQIEQDFLLDSAVFQGMRDGVFVDIGAHDGTTLSNTLVFERERGWRGLCIEPNPAVFTQLAKARKVPTLNVAVGAENGVLPFRQVIGHGEMLSGLVDTTSPDHMARVEREVARFGGNTTIIDVPVRRLDDILTEYGIDEVHYLSIDTEGAERADPRFARSHARLHSCRRRRVQRQARGRQPRRRARAFIRARSPSPRPVLHQSPEPVLRAARSISAAPSGAMPCGGESPS